jgi:nucleoside recognition membrane protein YjiH
MNNPLLYVFGAVGALIYAFPMYLAAASAEPPGKFAFTVMLFSIFTGAILAPVLVPALGHKWDFLVQPEPYPLAVAVGLASNPLMPIVIDKLTKWAEAYKPGGMKR